MLSIELLLMHAKSFRCWTQIAERQQIDDSPEIDFIDNNDDVNNDVNNETICENNMNVSVSDENNESVVTD